MQKQWNLLWPALLDTWIKYKHFSTRKCDTHCSPAPCLRFSCSPHSLCFERSHNLLLFPVSQFFFLHTSGSLLHTQVSCMIRINIGRSSRIGEEHMFVLITAHWQTQWFEFFIILSLKQNSHNIYLLKGSLVFSVMCMLWEKRK